MHDKGANSTPSPLTVEQIQLIFPIAPKDRRENGDLFQPFVAGSLKDDQGFYTGLLLMVDGAGIDALRRYDDRMLLRKDHRKTFGVRALRFLKVRMAGAFEIRDRQAVLNLELTPGSVEARIRDLFLKLGPSDSNQPGPDDASPPTEPPLASANWRDLARLLAEGAQALTAPEPVAAGELLALAESLVDACQAAADEARANAARQAAELWSRLSAFDPALAATCSDQLPPYDIEALSAALEVAETASSDHAAAEDDYQRLEGAWNQAAAAKDFPEVRRLLPSLEAAQATRNATSRHFAEVRADLVAILSSPGYIGLGGAVGGDTPDVIMAAPEPENDEPPLSVSGTSPNSELGMADATESQAMAKSVGPAETHVDVDIGGRADEDTVASTAAFGVAVAETGQPAERSVGGEALFVPLSPPAGGKQMIVAEEMAVVWPGGVRQEASFGKPDVAPGVEPIAAVEAILSISDPSEPLSEEWPAPVQAESPPAVGMAPGSALQVHLLAGEIAFSFHLARLSEAVGQPLPVPAAVLRCLALLRGIRRAEDMAEIRRSEAMALMTASLPEAGDSKAAIRLAVAALLRPALFDPDHGARNLLAIFTRDSVPEGYAPLVETLCDLGHDTRLSTQAFADLAGTSTRSAEPQAKAELRAWLAEARQSKTVHQPTYALFHRVLRADGRLGQVIESVVLGASDAVSSAERLVAELTDNRAAQEGFVAQTELQSGRPKRDRIEGMALEWFCRGIQEGCEALRHWLAARAQDAAAPQDRSREKIVRLAGTLRKVFDRCHPSPDSGDSPLAVAAGAVLAAAVEDLRAIVDGRPHLILPSGHFALLEAPLARLPGGCQDWTEYQKGFEDERTHRDRRLLAALCRPESIAPDIATAFEARLAERAILPARAALDQLRSSGLAEGTLAVHEQHLAEVTDVACHKARERVERLRQSFTTLSFLAIGRPEAVRSELTVLAAIAAAMRADPRGDRVTLPAQHGLRVPEVPPDFPELDERLQVLEEKRDQLKAEIAEKQRGDLRRLTSGPSAASARAILDRIDRLDPVTVDDAIAELNAGRNVPLLDSRTRDAFDRFFPDFVQSVEDAPKDIRLPKLLEELAAREGSGPLRLGTIDAAALGRAKQMIETWMAAESEMRSAGASRLRDLLTQLFGQIGLTGIKIGAAREPVPGRLRGFVMECDTPRSSGWFLPPAFGSQTMRQYRLLIARAEVPIEQIVRQIGSDAPDASWLVLVFGRLGVQNRQNLARRMRAEARQALVLDESLLLFVSCEGDDPLAAFFTAALPFAWVQPYTINPGHIPREMFFGRQAEIERIVSRDGDGCLIYGGRQLGKSALLNHICGERHRPAAGELAIYLDIKPIGGAGIPPGRIWDELAHALRRFAPMANPDTQPNAFVDSIRNWLDREPSRRILAMFDEADNFLRAEHAAGYPNLQKLKGLMEATGRRFKAVFAGLHNVRRMAQAPNSPLPHLGAPICIGPMNQEENRAALRRLAVEPMRAAGLDYADPDLAADMLARMNYYPSLVQVFGRQIVETWGRRAQIPTAGPRWKLDREALFEGEAAERIATQIRERFQLTLNLDIRYECIAKSIALNRLDHAGGDALVLAQGMNSAEVFECLVLPPHLANPTLPDLEELLREMVDLGVLGEFRKGLFGLRNAQIAQMLGDRDAIMTDLVNLVELDGEPAYDAAQFHGLLRPSMPNARAPLPDRALDGLFDAKRSGLRLVVAPPAVVGEDVADRLKAAAESWFEGGQELVRADDRQLGRAIDQAGSRKTVLIIDGPWSQETASLLQKKDPVKRGQIIPIWLLPAAPASVMNEVAVFHCRPWTEGMLRHWLADEGLAPALDDAGTRRDILSASGGAPARLAAMKGLLSELSTLPVADRSRRLEAWRKAQPLPHASLSLTETDIIVLRTLAEWHEALQSLAEFFETCPAATRDGLDRLIEMGFLAAGDRPDLPPHLTPLGRLVSP